MRAAAVQLSSTPDRDRNLEAADRLTRAAAARGAELVVLPEKWPVLGHAGADRRRARSRSTARRSTWARATARELGIDLVAGSIAERVRGRGPRREHERARRARRRGPRGLPQDPHVRRRGRRPHVPRVRARGAGRRDRSRRARRRHRPRPDHLLRPALPGALSRILAVRGAKVLTVPAAFTETTTRDHWEVLLRARAIEDQCFVIAANQVGEPAPGMRTGGRSMIVDPWGLVLAQAPDAETFVVADLDFDRLEAIRTKLPSLANRQAGAYRWPGGRPRVKAPAVDKRRLILDAAVRVFARQGFHTCRVVGHRRRGRRRLRPRLPLLPVQGRGARHALPRALGADARRDRRDRRASRSRRARSSMRSRRSSSTPTATTAT